MPAKKKSAIPTVEPMPEGTMIVAQFKSADGEATGPPLNLPGDATPEQLELLLNQLLNQVRPSWSLFLELLAYRFNSFQSEDPLPYSFHVGEDEIVKSLWVDRKDKSTEDAITIVYQPQAVFRVRAVTRCTSTLSGKIHFWDDKKRKLMISSFRSYRGSALLFL